MVSAKNAFPAHGWEVEDCSLVELPQDGLQGVIVAARSQTKHRLNCHWYQGVEDLGEEVLRAWLATDRSSLRGPTGALVIRLATELAPTREGYSRVEERLQELAEPVLRLRHSTRWGLRRANFLCNHKGLRTQ